MPKNNSGVTQLKDQRLQKRNEEKNGHLSPSESTSHTKQKVIQIPLTIAKMA